VGEAIAQPLTVTGPGLAWLLPTLPVASALLVLALGHRRARVAAWLATGSVAVTALAGAAVLSQLLRLPPDARALVVRLGPWLDVGGLQVDWALLVDPLSTVMVVLVTGVGLLVHLYSIGYMRDDPAVHRYFAYLNLFVAAMLLLVLGESLAVLFVGWELVGATSYLLVGFWSDRPGAGGAALKAFVVNRVGDVGFVIAMLVTFSALPTHLTRPPTGQTFDRTISPKSWSHGPPQPCHEERTHDHHRPATPRARRHVPGSDRPRPIRRLPLPRHQPAQDRARPPRRDHPDGRG